MNRNAVCSTVLVALFFATTLFASAQDTKLTAEQILARHLDAIGTAAARAAAKSRTAEGSVVTYSVVRTGSRYVDGQAAMFSSGRRSKTIFKFPPATQADETILCDGKCRATSTPGTELKHFLSGQPGIADEGLFGGAIFTAWPLLDLEGRKGKLRYDGLKKVDDKELHRVTYLPKKAIDAEIQLFFDPSDFKHVMTVYRLETLPYMSRNQIVSQRSAQNTRTVVSTLEERFGDFHTVNGLTLPSVWVIRYVDDAQQGANAVQWETHFQQMFTNPPVDESQVFGK